MTESELVELDNDVPQLAVKALADAQQRARRSGRVLVVRIDGKLVQVGPVSTIELKTLPPRKKVLVREKRAKR